uniref:T-complex protein 1 subunit zeta n=1 Tax=Salix viminalis TaxID=40686 RepID=A0A6N2MUW4_SALVM
MSLRVLNPNAEVLNKSAALHMNINAAKGLQDVLKSNLGPKGTIKMLVGGAGDIKLTKDGNTLLKKWTAVAQDDISGDGTTSTVIFIGELMKQSERYIDEGMHPRVLVDGFEIAKRATLHLLENFKTPVVMGDEPDREILKMVARTTIRTKLYEALADQLTDIVVNSVLCIRKPEEAIDLFMVEIMHMRHKFDVDTRLEIDDWFCYNFRQCCQEALRWHLHTCIGTLGEYGLSDEDFNYNHEMEDSSEGEDSMDEDVEGLVLDHGSRHPDMKRRAENCFILTCNVSLEYEKSEINAGFFYSNAEQREAMVCSGTDNNFVVINQKGIDPPSLDLLARAGIIALRRAKEEKYRTPGFGFLTPDCLGWAGLVYEQVLGEEKYTFVENVKNPHSCTILIKGPNDHTIAQIKDAVRDGLRAVKNTIEDEAVVLVSSARRNSCLIILLHIDLYKAVLVAFDGGFGSSVGAGAFELAARKHLINEVKKTVKGRAQLGVEAFADALLVVPKTLAENSGLDTQDEIVTLTGEHSRDNIVGINLQTGGTLDPQMEGIFDNYSVKRQLLNSGPVIASQLLLVDEVICAGRGKYLLHFWPGRKVKLNVFSGC